jgi:hypothetical protein
MYNFFLEYHEFEQLLITKQGDVEKDDGTCPWGTTYSVAKAYALLKNSDQQLVAFQWPWKRCCQKKHKVFCWLLLQDHLNTRDLLLRRTFFLDDFS